MKATLVFIFGPNLKTILLFKSIPMSATWFDLKFSHNLFFLSCLIFLLLFWYKIKGSKMRKYQIYHIIRICKSKIINAEVQTLVKVLRTAPREPIQILDICWLYKLQLTLNR